MGNQGILRRAPHSRVREPHSISHIQAKACRHVPLLVASLLRAAADRGNDIVYQMLERRILMPCRCGFQPERSHALLLCCCPVHAPDRCLLCSVRTSSRCPEPNNADEDADPRQLLRAWEQRPGHEACGRARRRLHASRCVHARLRATGLRLPSSTQAGRQPHCCQPSPAPGYPDTGQSHRAGKRFDDVPRWPCARTLNRSDIDTRPDVCPMQAERGGQ